MRILVTGAKGQLGKEVIRQFSPEYDVVGYGKEELNIMDEDQVRAVIKMVYPDVIIHTAAYTAVDACETNMDQAFIVNTLGTVYIARAAEEIGARIFYISTDYVFDGEKRDPYLEYDRTNPLTIYGLSKLGGEKAVRNLATTNSIIRTSWLYGHEGKNFVNTMLQLAKSNKKVRVVQDQIGCPTYTADLVEVLLALIHKPSGVYHVCNSGSCSWFEFAQSIYKLAGKDPDMVTPCLTEEYGAVALRPQYSVLATSELKKINISPPRKWEFALEEYVRKELAND